MLNNHAKRPRLLDLCCGVGGASEGYRRAGFDVYGVDKKPMPNYPFPFRRADALLYLIKWGHTFDAIHVSPPCQAYCTLTLGNHYGITTHLKLVAGFRKVLQELSVPSVIENVPTSDVRPDIVLCGEMFGLGVIRHRHFELTNWTGESPKHKEHRGRVRGMNHGVWYDGPYWPVHGKPGRAEVPHWQRAMGIDWTDNAREIAQAIPPAYTEYIGRQLMSRVENGA